MIYLGIGANLPHPRYGPPLDSCEAALGTLEGKGIKILRRSRWYQSAPVPSSDQPWFVNGVAEVATTLPPDRLLEALHAVEAQFGRVRERANAARVLDLDLLDYDSRVSPTGEPPILPHPRLAARAFVLLPLQEIAPRWRHPGTGLGIAQLIAALPPEQQASAIRRGDRPAPC